MEQLVDQLEQLTCKLVDRLHSVDSDELEQFVERRESIVSEMRAAGNGTASQTLKERVQRTLAFDDQIVARMQQLRDEASSHIQKMDVARQQRNMYEAQYTPDSVFFDKRK